MLWNDFDDEDYITTTSREQCSCEADCESYLRPIYCFEEDDLKKFQYEGFVNCENEVRLMKSKHISFLLNSLTCLPSGFVSLDASRAWIAYWITHALYLLGKEPLDLYPKLIDTLSHFQNLSGGFGGGPNQLSHGAPNYASVLTLCTIGTTESLSIINRKAMYQHLLKMKHPSGGFTMHFDGEVDTRATYTVISIARILNLLTPELTAGVADYILRCQTYEGGFGGEPGNEAHGGYNFCAVASLLILGEASKCDVNALEHWLLSRQMRKEGGFQGRTNKLVDSCYSFWQGAAVAMVEVIKKNGNDITDMEYYFDYKRFIQNESYDSIINESDGMENSEILVNDQEYLKPVTDFSGTLGFNQKLLQQYILQCGQIVEFGGIRDKPGKARDFYHTCYALSGLSIAQQSITTSFNPTQDEDSKFSTINIDQMDDVDENLPVIDQHFTGIQVLGDFDNVLSPTSCVFNIGFDKLKFALEFFAHQPNTHLELIS